MCVVAGVLYYGTGIWGVAVRFENIHTGRALPLQHCEDTCLAAHCSQDVAMLVTQKGELKEQPLLSGLRMERGAGVWRDGVGDWIPPAAT